ncbi:phosphatase PAP2 family protein [Bacteriovorax sp. PP10]|uniref:Phosphatase PAP2 family protein n=1 Tax=Bacteriovorax antarcticus TaxID=3088717 RepID=A0ABU5VTV8_9BACT|nr:phosphatase PAP2 family protein [Bacteriovorax sp. PP10]MEA9355823.1 phosphatase PAP2 family protein [Bacteriovorax sp. PP10]
MKTSKSLSIEFATLALIVSLAMIYSHESGFDIFLAGHFFNSTDQWMYRDSFVLEKILHKGGVIFSIVLLVAFLGRWLYLFKVDGDKKQRDYAGFVFLSSILTIITVFFLKRWSTLPCPWNSVAFGGGVNPPELLRAFALDLPNGHCFPAGHSSGGFCFLSLYFGYTFIYRKRNFKTLVPGLLIGTAFGMTQQMRGAHYLSHDLTTILLSITISWIMSLIYSYYDKNYEN